MLLFMNYSDKRKVWGNEPIAERLAHFSRARYTRKYKLGSTPCGNCNTYKHTTCRPRLDGAPCSCECERATRIREELDAERISAELHDRPMTITAMDIAKREGDRRSPSNKVSW